MDSARVTRMESAAHGKLFDYGVWGAPFLVDGLPAIIAVDDVGIIRKIRKIKPTDDLEQLGERLYSWLVEHHPRRQKLALVRETPPPAPAPPQIDPRLLSDPRSPLAKRAYLQRLAREAARKSSAITFRDEH
jgi:hypothetical protein